MAASDLRGRGGKILGSIGGRCLKIKNGVKESSKERKEKKGKGHLRGGGEILPNKDDGPHNQEGGGPGGKRGW